MLLSGRSTNAITSLNYPQLRRHEKKLQRIANELICGGSGGGGGGVEPARWKYSKREREALD